MYDFYSKEKHRERVFSINTTLFLTLFWLFHHQADLGPAVAQIQIWKLYSLPVRATHRILLTCSMELPPFGPIELQLSLVELGIPQMGHQAVSK